MTRKTTSFIALTLALGLLFCSGLPRAAHAATPEEIAARKAELKR